MQQLWRLGAEVWTLHPCVWALNIQYFEDQVQLQKVILEETCHEKIAYPAAPFENTRCLAVTLVFWLQYF